MIQRFAEVAARRFLSPIREFCARAALAALFIALFVALGPAVGADEVQLPNGVTEQLPDLSHGSPNELPGASVPIDKPAAAPKRELSVDLQAALGRPGTLNLHDVELGAALFMISDQWGINIVSGKVEGSVNGVFRNAPLREILDSILLSNGYNYRCVGESLVVSSVEDLGQINPFFQSATIPVRSADIDEVVQGAKLLTTPQGQVQAIKSARTIVVLDFPDRVKMIRDFVSTLEGTTGQGTGLPGQSLEVGYFRTQHVSVKSAEEALQAVISKEGRVGVMEGEDRLVISDHAENLAVVRTVLERIDRPRPQVRITALIYDISLKDVEELGINWRRIGYSDSSTEIAFGIDPITEGASTDPAGAGRATLAVGALLPHFDLNSVANALRTADDARLLANPSVCVLENEQAVFQSVSEIPYQQLTETQQGGLIGTTAFKDAGITLTVTPKIAADGTIRMIVMPEFSRVAGFTPGDDQPIIDKRSATTTFAVANRQTVAIGGLRQREDIGRFSGIPYLMDTRYVGKFFRYRKTDIRESELVLFISPEIVSPCDPVLPREANIIDTVGCRLNQIPEAEGCVPPPPCVYRQTVGYQPVDFATSAPSRLPATSDDEVAARSSAIVPPATEMAGPPVSSAGY